MNMTIRYFKQHSRSTLIRFAIMTFICLVVITLVTQGVIEEYERWREYEYTNGPYYHNFYWTINPQLPFFVMIAVVMTTILPIVELSAFNSRKYLDSAFSFPISRKALVSVNLLNGFIQFLLAYTVSFIWYVIRLGHCYKLNFLPIWEFFFISLLYSLFLYCFNAFFFSLCNSSADGAIIAITWHFLLCPLALTYTEMLGIKWYDQLLLIVWMPLGMMSEHCGNLAEGFSSTPNLGTTNPNAMLISLICAGVLAVALCAGTIFFFSRKRAESAGEISKTPVGYKTLIPVCSGILLYWALEADASFISLMALIFSTVAYIIYRRGVRLKAFDIIVIGACFVCFMMGLMG